MSDQAPPPAVASEMLLVYVVGALILAGVFSVENPTTELVATDVSEAILSPESDEEAIVAPAPVAIASQQIELGKHDRIALVGGSLAERMNLFGHFETLLHSRLPNLELKVRNFGWPADEVSLQQRPNNYTAIDDPLEVFSPSIFFCFFGFNESFAGAENVLQFKQHYLEYLDGLAKKFAKQDAPLRFVLISPIAFESSQDSYQPQGVIENANLQLYSDAVREVAIERELPFVELFQATKTLFGAEEGLQYTINGVHLNEAGDLAIGQMLDTALFGEPTPASIGYPVYEALRAAVNDKSWVHANDYRMLNGWYVYGGRRTYDVETFPSEYKKIRKMSAVRDRRVWDIAQGKPVSAEPDDSDTGELITPPTGLGRHYPRAEPEELRYLPPEECVELMEVPEGYEVQPFASEREFPELANPCQLNFDNLGRLWVACMPNYPQWRPGDPPPDDRLLILEDSDQDGRADSVKVFYDKLICPTGFEFWNGGVLVIDEPRILFLRDTDGDDRADEVIKLLDGIATDDTHHTMGAWEWSPGGLLHMLEGIQLSTTLETPWGPFRNRRTAGSYVLDPRSLRIRRFQTPGFGNPWCLVFDRWGNGVVGDGSNARQHWTAPLSGLDPSIRSTSRPIFDNQSMRPAVGNEFLVSRHFPDEVQGQLIYACVINMNGFPRFTVEDESGTAGLTGGRVEDLLKSSDMTFRPVDPQIGPDGALWFGDWCNALIGHMQYSQRDPNRDKRHGRIYRLVHKERPLLEPITQAGKSIVELLEQLKAYESRTRYRARRELRDRDRKQVLPAIDEWIKQQDPVGEQLLCEALWVQEAFHAVDAELLQTLLGAESFRARAAAVHVLGNRLALRTDDLSVAGDAALLATAIRDKHPRVRLEAIRSASFLNSTLGAQIALDALKSPSDYWIRYTLNHALQAMRPKWLPSYIKGEFLAEGDNAKRAFLEELLESLGPSAKAIPHLQVLTDGDADRAARDAAVAELMALPGKRGHGEAVFNRVCTACHRIGNRGVTYGPDLTQMYKRSEIGDLRKHIIYSILEPNLEIDKKYETVQVLTAEGQLISGFLESSDDEGIVLSIAGGKTVEIAHDDIDDQSTARVSSMPEGLALTVAPHEFLDLVEYLTSLNKAGRSSAKP